MRAADPGIDSVLEEREAVEVQNDAENQPHLLEIRSVDSLYHRRESQFAEAAENLSVEVAESPAVAESLSAGAENLLDAVERSP